MKKLYFTLVGTSYYYGKDFLKLDMELKLKKEPDNKVDKEAIRVELDPIGLIGYVANSPYTVIGDCMSAGRLYDKILDEEKATIKFILDDSIICLIEKEDLKENIS